MGCISDLGYLIDLLTSFASIEEEFAVRDEFQTGSFFGKGLDAKGFRTQTSESEDKKHW